MKLLLVAMVMLVAQTNALWFWGRNEETTATADGRPVDEGCVAEGEAGECEFFGCFEERLPCGRTFYMQRLGNHYCRRFRREMDSFTEEGQRFLLSSQQCVTSGLVAQYRREHVNCHQLEHLAVGLIRPCYLQHGFCRVISTNARQFLRVFQISDLFSAGAGKLWLEVVGLARECGGEALVNFWRATASRFPLLSSLLTDN